MANSDYPPNRSDVLTRDPVMDDRRLTTRRTEDMEGAESVWKAKMETDIGELQTNVATIQANDAHQLRELKSISHRLSEMYRIINTRPPVWPAFALGLTGISILGALAVFTISPLSNELAELRERHNTELKDLYYSVGRLEAFKEGEK